jgi:hypothetical protein
VIVDDDDAPIYVDLVGFATEDPLLDYDRNFTSTDALLSQVRTIINLLEEIKMDQTELDAKVQPILDALGKLQAREDAEAAVAPLDTTKLDSIAPALDALDAAAAAREPAPAAPAAPAIDPNTGQPVVPAA